MTSKPIPPDERVRAHTLKCWKPYFEEVIQGRKTFEVRKHDRDFRVGDSLTLLETEIGGAPFTGREHDTIIAYLLHGGSFGIESGYCVLALRSRQPDRDAVIEEAAAVVDAEIKLAHLHAPDDVQTRGCNAYAAAKVRRALQSCAMDIRALKRSALSTENSNG